jgi:hypothetical protein
VTSTLPGADIRGFYAALGVQLPASDRTEASVRCFANPDEHQHGDRNPSCSINLENGAWNCHGCLDSGGPYDAADRRGRTPREAMDLLITFGLAQRRGRRSAGLRRPERPRHARPPGPPAPPPRRLELDEHQLARWQRQLRDARWPLAELRPEQRAMWKLDVLTMLGVGLDGHRLAIPIRDAGGALQGALRYAPSRHTGQLKALAMSGSRHGLIPHPSTDPTEEIVLDEGVPDLISARSLGIPAFALSSPDAWRASWAELLAGRCVLVVMDCDLTGRTASARILEDLLAADVRAAAVDLSPQRSDGYDLTDWLTDHRHRHDVVPPLRRLIAMARS